MLHSRRNSAGLSESACPSRNQEEAYANHDHPDGSRDALAIRCEPFASNCCRDKSHNRQIHDPDDKEDRGKAGATVNAVEAEAQPVSPSRASIRRRRRTLVSPWFSAAG
jgi:hypothetical protein